MIVYGDPEFSISFETAHARLLRMESIAGERHDSISASRNLLIACGQVEQGLADLAMEAPGSVACSIAARLPAVERATDLAARQFLEKLRPSEHHFPDHALRNQKLRDGITAALATPTGAPHLRIKIPEGYAFYCLYPEQYVQASIQWLNANQPNAPVFVLGIRSIGTGLSAVVKAVLESANITAHRSTIRPTGHPFERRADLRDFPTACQHAIVVDEGPGLSGSSMAAAVKVLRENRLTDITIFPSHTGEPGSAANSDVRHIWSRTPRIVCPVIVDDWRNSPLFEKFKSETERLLESPVVSTADLSGGQWRTLFNCPLEAFPTFERTKYLFRAENGRAVLWKFAGLGCGGDLQPFTDVSIRRQKQLASLAWTSLPLAQCSGFIASEWFDGVPLSPGDLDDAMIARLATYIHQCATSAPSLKEAFNNFERLKKITCSNAREAFGPERAAEISILADQAAPPMDFPSHGDGRVAPHEWIVTASGRIFKTDVWGHDADHTCIGPQNILWDVAGAISEWDMPASAAERFLAFLDLSINPATLRFYLEAYSVWRAARYTLANKTLPALPKLLQAKPDFSTAAQ